ncbi:hypothetical protein FACS189485_16680 [Spirochaetia bacterium]|nr:hypothetical protein FACS189485_16680 [Spirochaetia bacterium]
MDDDGMVELFTKAKCKGKDGNGQYVYDGSIGKKMKGVCRSIPKCDFCGSYSYVEYNGVVVKNSPLAVLRDELWAKITKGNTALFLCVDCVEGLLGREIQEEDLNPKWTEKYRLESIRARRRCPMVGVTFGPMFNWVYFPHSFWNKLQDMNREDILTQFSLQYNVPFDEKLMAEAVIDFGEEI